MSVGFDLGSKLIIILPLCLRTPFPRPPESRLTGPFCEDKVRNQNFKIKNGTVKRQGRVNSNRRAKYPGILQIIYSIHLNSLKLLSFVPACPPIAMTYSVIGHDVGRQPSTTWHDVLHRQSFIPMILQTTMEYLEETTVSQDTRSVSPEHRIYRDILHSALNRATFGAWLNVHPDTQTRLASV